MPRPRKCRRVGYIPQCRRFVPENNESEFQEEISMSIEEIEAVRLADLEGLDQQKCAEKMEISRGTFQRILNSSRFKISDALVNGKIISIDGGCYKREHCSLVCSCCGFKFLHINSGTDNEAALKCVKCNSSELRCESISKCSDKKCLKHCNRRKDEGNE